MRAKRSRFSGHCPSCRAELDEVYTSGAVRAAGKHLPPGELKYACPECDLEWRRSDEGPLVPLT